MAGLEKMRWRAMRDYQPTMSRYTLPRATYMRTKWTIKDYPRLYSVAHDSQHQCRASPDSSVSRYQGISNTVYAIESALQEISSQADRRAILDHIIYDRSWPIDKSARTYSALQQRFIYNVAKKLYYI